MTGTVAAILLALGCSGGPDGVAVPVSARILPANQFVEGPPSPEWSTIEANDQVGRALSVFPAGEGRSSGLGSSDLPWWEKGSGYFGRGAGLRTFDPQAETLGANVWVVDAPPSEGLDAAAMLKIARTYTERLEYCYALSYSDTREDRASLTVTLRSNGTVHDVQVFAETLDAKARACIAKQFRLMSFPEPPSGTGIATFRLRMAVRTCGPCE